MTEFGIEEKNILSSLGLDGLPVHIRRKTESLKKVNFRLDRIESRLATMKPYTE